MSGTGSGRKIYISNAYVPNADLSQSGFEALTYVEITRVGKFANIPMSTNYPTYGLLTADVADKQKGLTTPGDTSLELRPLPTDAGQVLLAAAALTRKSWAFKIEEDDAPDANTTNSIMYIRAVVGASEQGLGGSDDFRTESYPIGVQQLPVKVAGSGVAAPANTVLPSIAGIVQTGHLLTGYAGDWTGYPTFAYQWQQDASGDGNFVDITGATSSTYTVVVGSVGNSLRLKVTGTNTHSAVIAYSAPSQVSLAA
jgi:hypothetical protein